MQTKTYNFNIINLPKPGNHGQMPIMPTTYSTNEVIVSDMMC